jgi:hypothetical protein
MSALPDHRRQGEFGSHYSLPAESGYRGGSLGRDDSRKAQPTRGGFHNSSPAHEHSSKHGTTASGTSKSKTAKSNVESISLNSSDSDD